MKTFTKGMIAVALVLAMTFMAGGEVLAGRGYQGGNSGNGVSATTATTGNITATPATGNTAATPCTGTCLNAAATIFNGAPVNISGTISEVLYYGQGIKIDTGNEVVTIYGFGPFWYWDQLGVARPVVGDSIAVEGYNVTYSDGSEKIIAMSVTVNEVAVSLRDSETGAPLWRGGLGNRGAGNTGNTGNTMRGRGQGMVNGTCPWLQTAPATETEE